MIEICRGPVSWPGKDPKHNSMCEYYKIIFCPVEILHWNYQWPSTFVQPPKIMVDPVRLRDKWTVIPIFFRQTSSLHRSKISYSLSSFCHHSAFHLLFIGESFSDSEILVGNSALNENLSRHDKLHGLTGGGSDYSEPQPLPGSNKV